MKKSELRSIIREELKSVFEGDTDWESKFSKMVTGDKPKTSGPGNRMYYTLETLPKYDKLVPTRKETDMVHGPKILLPNLSNSVAYQMIFTIKDAQEWKDEFMKKYGINPGQKNIKFILDSLDRPEVINSDKFKEFWEAGQRGISEFYDKPKYKGD